jgi:hypothetical protein
MTAFDYGQSQARRPVTATIICTTGCGGGIIKHTKASALRRDLVMALSLSGWVDAGVRLQLVTRTA